MSLLQSMRRAGKNTDSEALYSQTGPMDCLPRICLHFYSLRKQC